jgi:hypothetical protein
MMNFVIDWVSTTCTRPVKASGGAFLLAGAASLALLWHDGSIALAARRAAAVLICPNPILALTPPIAGASCPKWDGRCPKWGALRDPQIQKAQSQGGRESSISAAILMSKIAQKVSKIAHPPTRRWRKLNQMVRQVNQMVHTNPRPKSPISRWLPRQMPHRYSTTPLLAKP